MTTVVLGPRPPELEAVIERRRRLGLDRFDEMWEGSYHMVPGPGPDHAMMQAVVMAALNPHLRSAGLIPMGQFNLGEADDYRVPDGGALRARWAESKFVPTAALVVEIVSPDDETWAKLDFYAVREVDELVIGDPAARSISWLIRQGSRWEPSDRSGLLGVDVVDLVDQVTWP